MTGAMVVVGCYKCQWCGSFTKRRGPSPPDVMSCHCGHKSERKSIYTEAVPVGGYQQTLGSF